MKDALSSPAWAALCPALPRSPSRMGFTPAAAGMGVRGGSRAGSSAVQPGQHRHGELWGWHGAEPCKGEMFMWAVPCTPHNTRGRVMDTPINHGLQVCARSRVRPWAEGAHHLLEGGVWELVLWRVLDAACGFRDAGLPCQQDGITSAAASSPGQARREGKSYRGDERSCGRGQGTVMAGDGHTRGRSHPGPEGVRRGRRGGMEV